MEFNVPGVWHHLVDSGKKDAGGNPKLVPSDDPVSGVFDPGGSTEYTDLQQQTVTQPRYILEPGAAVPSAVDRFTILGLRYEVDGDPQVFSSPFQSGRAKIGPVVNLKRVTG